MSNFFRKYFLITSPEASASAFPTAANRSSSNSEGILSLRSGRFEFEAIVREIRPRERGAALEEEEDRKENRLLLEEEDR